MLYFAGYVTYVCSTFYFVWMTVHAAHIAYSASAGGFHRTSQSRS